jgi:hypothetical protein
MIAGGLPQAFDLGESGPEVGYGDDRGRRAAPRQDLAEDPNPVARWQGRHGLVQEPKASRPGDGGQQAKPRALTA